MRISIPYADVTAFIEQLGADLNDVHSVHIDHGAVTVVENRRDEDGCFFNAGYNAATVTTEIRIERGA